MAGGFLRLRCRPKPRTSLKGVVAPLPSEVKSEEKRTRDTRQKLGAGQYTCSNYSRYSTPFDWPIVPPGFVFRLHRRACTRSAVPSAKPASHFRVDGMGAAVDPPTRLPGWATTSVRSCTPGLVGAARDVKFGVVDGGVHEHGQAAGEFNSDESRVRVHGQRHRRRPAVADRVYTE